MTRNLLCPICGAILSVPCDETTGGIPGEFLLPRHDPAVGHGNLCAAYRVRVCFDRATCERCGTTIIRVDCACGAMESEREGHEDYVANERVCEAHER